MYFIPLSKGKYATCFANSAFFFGNKMVEFAEYGNFDESSSLFCVERLCRFTIQAATALEHLEKNKVIHQAVNPFTCLVVAKNQVRFYSYKPCMLLAKTSRNHVAPMMRGTVDKVKAFQIV